MPLLHLSFRNSGYFSRDDGLEYDSPEAALAVGVQSAAVMASDEVARGNQSAAIEVCVEQADGTRVLCSVVAIAISPMLATIAPDLDIPD